ncbi:hypothetical protein J5N97_016589 [Dioscorea zingiberensis]|uniref:Avr9/Cf-9 rapidly elicited protein 146 n=1 Tax=Dioscorea zingiberensis TaxID=325984 RepID=A0A9D5CKJ7_9LILI|nr:hypothetical protein J5N97_016589 [Dioscorea zingiberensis]
MELHSPAAAKRLWNFLRVAFYMMRKGLISKRKLIMDMNLMVKRGKLVGKKTLGNLMFHHHHHHHHSRQQRGSGSAFQDYEFSCSNSPNPVFFHAAAKRRHNYFPCIHAIAEDESPSPVIVLPRIEFSPQTSHDAFSEIELAPGVSPLSVRVSDFSDDDAGDGSGREVDDEAEEFIKRFYEQLRAQSRIALLQYQEMEFQNMLARGA